MRSRRSVSVSCRSRFNGADVIPGPYPHTALRSGRSVGAWRSCVTPPALSGLVAGYVGYQERLDPEAVHHGLPSPTVTVIVAFDEPLECGWLAAPGRSDRFWTLASGLHTGPALVRPHGHSHGIQLALTPRGARDLLGTPASALAGELVGHHDLPLGLSEVAHTRLTELPDWGARFRYLDGQLLGMLRSRRLARPAPEVEHAWELLTRSGGQVRVSALAREVGWSRRHLLARFRAEYGVTPKEAAMIARFDRARRMIDGGLPAAVVAHRCGFSDQQHLARDWRRMAGRTIVAHRGGAYDTPPVE